MELNLSTRPGPQYESWLAADTNIELSHLNACYYNSADGRGTFGDYGSDPLNSSENVSKSYGPGRTETLEDRIHVCI